MMDRRTGRIMLLGAGALSLTAGLAGCGASTPTATSKKGPVDIVYWSGHASGALHAAVVQEVADFNATHPGIHVTFKPEGASSHGLAAFEAGRSPNVGMVSSYVVPQFAKAGALVNLKSYLDGSQGLTTAEIHKLYYPTIWSDMQNGNGVQYMMPLEKKANMVIYYNESLFKKAGITNLPTTWNEVSRDAAKIRALGSKYHGFAWTPYLGDLYEMTLANGGQVFTTATHRTHFALDNSGAVQALSMLRNWIKNGTMILTSGFEYQLDFGTGNIGMVIDTTAGYTYDKSAIGGKFAMGGIPSPAGTSGHSSQYINGASLVMFNTGTSSQRAASWTFMKYMSSPATNTYWDKHTNYLPLGPQETSNMQSFWSQHPAQAGSFSDPAQWWYKPRGAVGNWTASQTAMDSIFEKALNGTLGITQALKQMDTVGTSYLTGKVRG